MDEIIAGITRSIMAEMENDEQPRTEETLLEYLEEYYNSAYFNLMAVGNSATAMVRLVAVTQMIQALKLYPNE